MLKQFYFLLLLFAASTLHAQLTFEKITSHEGYPTALEAAKKGLDTPDLIGIATITGEYSYQQLTFDLEFDLAEGKATTWLYVFRSATQPDSAKSWFVIKAPFVGMQAMNFDMFDLSYFTMFFADKQIHPDSCLDSRQMIDSIRKTSAFEIIASDTTWELNIAGLGVAANNAVFEKDKPFWLVSFSKENERLNCYVHAETGETICMKIASVGGSESKYEKLDIWPNPGYGTYSVKLPVPDLYTEPTIKVFTAEGKQEQVIWEIAGDKLSLNCTGLSQGIYFLVISINSKHYTTVFINLNK